MSVVSKFRKLTELFANRRECIEYLRSPRRALASDLIQNPNALPCPVLVREGTTTKEERSFLQELVRETSKEAGPIVEIGTLFGFTTTVLAEAKTQDRALLTVDSFSWNPWGLSPKEHQNLTEEVLKLGISRMNVQLVACEKELFYDSYSGPSPSLVFLDAIHSYEETRKDILWAKSVGCGVIAGHDFSSDFEGVVRAVMEQGRPDVRGTAWALRIAASATI